MPMKNLMPRLTHRYAGRLRGGPSPDPPQTPLFADFRTEQPPLDVEQFLDFLKEMC